MITSLLKVDAKLETEQREITHRLEFPELDVVDLNVRTMDSCFRDMKKVLLKVGSINFSILISAIIRNICRLILGLKASNSSSRVIKYANLELVSETYLLAL